MEDIMFKEIVAIICLVTLILIAIFMPIVNKIFMKKFFNDVKLGSIYKYYGYGEMNNPFKYAHYYFQIIDKEDGYFQYKKYRSYSDIVKDDYMIIESEDINTMRRMILNSDFIELRLIQ